MCEVTPPAVLILQMDDRAPRRARQFLREAHCPEHNASVLDEAVLLLSELVTNAMRHGAPPITAEVTCRGTSGMQVRVSDGNPAAPTARDAGPGDQSGRGVGIVDMLSDAWGVDPTPNGKTVWFRLRE
jgi:anti-sigma regulatory factor (Ser/Thr protein kinase)